MCILYSVHIFLWARVFCTVYTYSCGHVYSLQCTHISVGTCILYSVHIFLWAHVFCTMYTYSCGHVYYVQCKHISVGTYILYSVHIFLRARVFCTVYTYSCWHVSGVPKKSPRSAIIEARTGAESRTQYCNRFGSIFAPFIQTQTH